MEEVVGGGGVEVVRTAYDVIKDWELIGRNK